MINIAIADKYPLFRKAIIELLSVIGIYSCIIETSTGEELLNLLSTLFDIPDLIILGIDNSVQNNVDIIEVLQQNYSKMKVVVLLADYCPETYTKIFSLGVTALAFKSQKPEEILETIVESTKSFKSKQEKNKLLTKSFLISPLTKREAQILELLRSELTYKEIAHKINLSENTVDKHRAAIFKKLNVKSRVSAVMKFYNKIN